MFFIILVYFKYYTSHVYFARLIMYTILLIFLVLFIFFFRYTRHAVPYVNHNIRCEFPVTACENNYCFLRIFVIILNGHWCLCYNSQPPPPVGLATDIRQTVSTVPCLASFIRTREVASFRQALKQNVRLKCYKPTNLIPTYLFH